MRIGLGKKKVKKVALERIMILFELALSSDERLRKRYGELILAIKKKARIRIPKKIKRRICKKCGDVWIPGVNLSVRIYRKKVIYKCKTCGEIYRFQIKS